jgi:alpha-galactosidase
MRKPGSVSSSVIQIGIRCQRIEVKIMSFKIAIIGAGSVGFTKKAVHRHSLRAGISDVEFALTDMSEHNLG